MFNSCSPRMYRRQFAKWGWKKYGRGDRHGQITRTCIRARKERARLKMPSLQVLTPRLFIQPADDEVTHHKSRITSDMPSLIRMWMASLGGHNDRFSNTRGPDSETVDRLISNCTSLFTGIFEFAYGSPHKGRLQLEEIFGRIADQVRPGNLEALVLFCLILPYSLPHLQLTYLDTAPLHYTPEPLFVSAKAGQIVGLYVHFVAALARLRLGAEHPISSALAGLKLMLTTAPQNLGDFADFLQDVLHWTMRSIGYRSSGGYGIMKLYDDDKKLISISSQSGIKWLRFKFEARGYVPKEIMESFEKRRIIFALPLELQAAKYAELFPVHSCPLGCIY